MASLTDIAEKIFTLTSNVSDLKANVSRIDEIIREHDQKITKLEAREDFIIEKCKSTALEAVNVISNGLTEKLTEMNMKFKQLDS
ncbi:MAG: hypothetical protein ABJ004_16750 [Cyclobacteriaceae bacterium]